MYRFPDKLRLTFQTHPTLQTGSNKVESSVAYETHQHIPSQSNISITQRCLLLLYLSLSIFPFSKAMQVHRSDMRSPADVEASGEFEIGIWPPPTQPAPEPHLELEAEPGAASALPHTPPAPEPPLELDTDTEADPGAGSAIHPTPPDPEQRPDADTDTDSSTDAGELLSQDDQSSTPHHTTPQLPV